MSKCPFEFVRPSEQAESKNVKSPRDNCKVENLGEVSDAGAAVIKRPLETPPTTFRRDSYLHCYTREILKNSTCEANRKRAEKLLTA